MIYSTDRFDVSAFKTMRNMKEKCLDKKIIIVGDFFLDRYIYIDNEETDISIYTGQPVYNIKKTVCVPGAAGTIAKNMSVLGVKNIYAVGVCGNDGDGFVLRNELENLHIDVDNILISEKIKTPSYTMIMRGANGEYEETGETVIQNFTEIDTEIERLLIKRLYDLIENVIPDAIVFLDQLNHRDRGVVSQKMKSVIGEIKKQYPKVISLVDSRMFIDEITSAVIRKCNEGEFCNTYKVSPEMITDKCKVLSKDIDQIMIVTLGSKGSLIAKKGEVVQVPAFKVSGRIDTRGAGDAFTTGFVIAKTCDLQDISATVVGNAFAACCVEQLATTGWITWRLVERVIGK